jgi:hypothetical protein
VSKGIVALQATRGVFGYLGKRTKEKKGKENVLIDLELVNLRNASLLNSKELRRKITNAEK